MNDLKVYLAVTEGCSACKLMEHFLKDLQEEYNYELVVCKFNELPVDIRTILPIGDFPTTVVTKSEKVLSHFAGSRTKQYIRDIFNDIV